MKNRPDSEMDTRKHIGRVQELLGQVQGVLKLRADVHDVSKLGADEKPYFDAAMSLWGMTYGSPKYKAALARLGPALEHHYKVNDHHPEHFGTFRCPICHRTWMDNEAPGSTCFEATKEYGGHPRFCPKCSPVGAIFEASLIPNKPSLDWMNLIQLLEMLADWKAASERHANGNLARSIEVNTARFNMTVAQVELLRSTAEMLGWL